MFVGVSAIIDDGATTPLVSVCFREDTHLKSLAPPLSSSPMINPKRPRTDEKISITRILTKL
jgi:hypothetical protein